MLYLLKHKENKVKRIMFSPAIFSVIYTGQDTPSAHINVLH